MELDNVASIAVRTLATDLANLTARLAVMTGVIEDLLQQTNGLDPSTWEPEPIRAEGADADAPPTDYRMHLPGAEMTKIQQILQSIRSMQ